MSVNDLAQDLLQPRFVHPLRAGLHGRSRPWASGRARRRTRTPEVAVGRLRACLGRALAAPTSRDRPLPGTARQPCQRRPRPTTPV